MILVFAPNIALRALRADLPFRPMVVSARDLGVVLGYGSNGGNLARNFSQRTWTSKYGRGWQGFVVSGDVPRNSVWLSLSQAQLLAIHAQKDLRRNATNGVLIDAGIRKKTCRLRTLLGEEKQGAGLLWIDESPFEDRGEQQIVLVRPNKKPQVFGLKLSVHETP